ncbi:MAG: RNA methyltransferase [Pseudomonadota bacterium]
MSKKRGYFAMGVEGISKPGNVGNLVRSAHSFGASFFFTIDPVVNVKEVARTDTSEAFDHLPFYNFKTPADLMLPDKCQLVGIEFLEEAVELPSFRHPSRAAYVLGRERGNLSPELLERCDYVIKIPMQFCVNVGVAGAIVMYDRLTSTGRFAPRPVRAGGPTEFLPEHVHGGQVIRRDRKGQS